VEERWREWVEKLEAVSTIIVSGELSHQW